MHNLISKLIIYRNVGEDTLLSRLAEVYRKLDGEYDKAALTSEVYACINELLHISTKYGFDKNLWHNYVAFLLATTENPFTLVCEKRGAANGSVKDFAVNDFKVFLQLFNYDFSNIERALDIDCFTTVSNYTAVVKSEQIFNKSVSDKVRYLSKCIEELSAEHDIYDVVTQFYKDYGVGTFGLNKAFRLSPEGDGRLIPITAPSDVKLDDLVGYDLQKARLIENTEAFVEGRGANNVLLYGDAGTGKSTSIKAILNKYYDRGLRMIEIYKHEFKYLAKIISEVKNRNYKFIIYMDDLSFEDFEIEYKYLKAVIEGGLDAKPDNVLIYATSNRRHLIKETWSDRSDISEDELHRSDTMQEKLSLVARFGITIGYYSPDQQEYFNIVLNLAHRYPEITLSDDELIALARQWEIKHNGKSGRTAQQFINNLLGKSSNG